MSQEPAPVVVLLDRHYLVGARLAVLNSALRELRLPDATIWTNHVTLHSDDLAIVHMSDVYNTAVVSPKANDLLRIPKILKISGDGDRVAADEDLSRVFAVEYPITSALFERVDTWKAILRAILLGELRPWYLSRRQDSSLLALAVALRGLEVGLSGVGVLARYVRQAPSDDTARVLHNCKFRFDNLAAQDRATFIELIRELGRHNNFLELANLEVADSKEALQIIRDTYDRVRRGLESQP